MEQMNLADGACENLISNEESKDLASHNIETEMSLNREIEWIYLLDVNEEQQSYQFERERKESGIPYPKRA